MFENSEFLKASLTRKDESNTDPQGSSLHDINGYLVAVEANENKRFLNMKRFFAEENESVFKR